MTDRRLIVAAARVAHRAPEDWAEFISAFVAYTDDRRDECIQSPPDMLQVAQGRAQACASLRRLLADCTKTADSIEKRKSPAYR